MDTLLQAGLNNTAWAAALAVLAWCATRLCRNRPALAHVLWLAVMLKLVTPSLVSVSVPAWPAATRATPSPTRPTQVSVADEPRAGNDGPPVRTALAEPAPVVDAPAEPARVPSRPFPWRPFVIGVWAAGGAVWWLTVGLYALRFRRFLGSARPAPAELRTRAEGLAAQLGLRGCPALALVPARVPPMLWALFGRPRLLLPEALWEGLSPAQQETVLAHELAHLKRRDHWVRRLEVLVLGLHWWNPLAWWARREVERAEEPCCDAWVTWALPESAHDYAEALVATAAFLSGPRPFRPIGASGAGRARSLKRRLIMLLSDPPSRPWARGVPGAVLLLAALSLPLLPVWAARADDDRKDAPSAPAPAPKAETSPPADARPEAPKADLPAQSRRLELGQPVEREVSDYEEFTGRVEPLQSVEFFARVSGAITRVHSAPGAVVKRGDILLEIDPRAFQAELSRADAELQRAKARVKPKAAMVSRQENLLKRGPDYVSKEEFIKAQAEQEEAEAEVRSAQATRELATLALESARVTSPIDGRLTFILPADNVVTADKTRVATVVSLDPVAVAFDVDERTVLRLRRMMREGKLRGGASPQLPVTMALADESDFPHRGQVSSLDAVFDPASGTARWRAVFPNADHSLVPGLFARVHVITGIPHKALLVPQRAVFTDAGNRYVSASLGRDGAFEKRPVKLGKTHGDFVEILEGRLSPQDRIYLENPGLH